MKKKIVVLLCVFALLTGIFATVSAADTDAQQYLVGYAKKDMNPWVDPTDHTKGVIPINLTGNGNDDQRACTGLMDDTGDGVIDNEDGLQTTCTVVTDPYGTTVMYITIDSLQGYRNLTTDVRAAVVAQLGSSVISQSQIMVCASHTHSSAYFAGLKNSTNPDFKRYYEYVLSQMTAAAIEAYNDREAATMTKGSIDATDSTASMGYNGGKGFAMNVIRHYDITSAKGSDKKSYVAGSNFGNGGRAVGTSAGTGLSGYKVTSFSHVAEADNTLHLLKFDFAEGSQKKPVVMVNWRCHPTTNSSSSGTTKTIASADYVGSLRYNLEKAGYRAAFLQGAAGNTIDKSTVSDDWVAVCPGKKKTMSVYGRILAEIALDCMEKNMTDPLPVGKIRALQNSWYGQPETDTPGLQAAALDYFAKLEAGTVKDTDFPYKYIWPKDGKTYILNSKFHANKVKTRMTQAASYTTLELDVISIGNAVMFVSAPNELSDYYDINGSLRPEDNDWLDLVDEQTYGTPFVLGYTNDSKGYLPNYLNYTYNSPEYYALTGRGKDGSTLFAEGSYEANTSSFDQGQGEALIAEFGRMIDIVTNGFVTRNCEECGEVVQWTPMLAGQSSNQYLGSGHYYLLEDFPLEKNTQKMMVAGDTLCLDLNGHSIETKGRSFYIVSGVTVSIFDSAGGGSVTSYSGNNNVGGGVVLNSGGTFNLYGGTLRFIRSDDINPGYETSKGGVISSSGTVNIYGGCVQGGELLESEYNAVRNDVFNGCGASIYMSFGKLNMYGGSIKAGKAAPDCYGDCIYIASGSARVVIDGDPVVDDICYGTRNAATLTIKGTYTGTMSIGYDPRQLTFTDRLDIGNLSKADITGATLTCSTDPGARIIGSGSNILVSLYDADTVAAIHDSQGTRRFTALQDAVSAYSGGYIRLLKDQTEAVTVDRDIEIDLYGCDMIADVAQDATLCAWDTRTDDFKVVDSYGYGKLTLNSGAAKAAESYVMLEDEGTLSFHRYALELTAMNLRPGEAGLYYLSNFSGDELIAEHITRFGVILSVQEEPTEQNLSQCRWSAFTDFTAGKDKNTDVTGTLLKNILKPTNQATTNQYHSQLPVYGRAYILLDDGQYLFGACASRSLRTQVEMADALWGSLDETQTEAMLTMYETYPDLMNSWNIPNLLAAEQEKTQSETAA